MRSSDWSSYVCSSDLRVLFSLLFARGFRYRLHVRGLPGSPDLVFPKRKAVVFVHGCFWHRHEGCRYTTTPRTNEDFWRQKFQGNVARDRRHAEMLHALGWRVAVVWECALKHSVEEIGRASCRERVCQYGEHSV